MASRNIWDILNDVNYEPNTLAASPSDFVPATKPADPPLEGAIDVSKVSEEPVGDNKDLTSKSSGISRLTIPKSKLSDIPSLDVIRTRLKLSTKTTNKRPSPRKKVEDTTAFSPQKKQPKPVTDSQRAKWRERKRRQRERVKLLAEDIKAVDDSGDVEPSKYSITEISDDSATTLSRSCHSETSDTSLTSVQPTTASVIDSNCNVLQVNGVKSDDDDGGITMWVEGGAASVETSLPVQLGDGNGTGQPASSRMESTECGSGPTRVGGLSRGAPYDYHHHHHQRTDLADERTPDQVENGILPVAAQSAEMTSKSSSGSSKEAMYGRDSEMVSDSNDIRITSTLGVVSSDTDKSMGKELAIRDLRMSKTGTKSSAGQIGFFKSNNARSLGSTLEDHQPQLHNVLDSLHPMSSPRLAPDLFVLDNETSRSGNGDSSEPNVAQQDIMVGNVPLDLSKKQPPCDSGQFTRILDKEERCHSAPNPDDEVPLDLSVKKTNAVMPLAGYHLSSPVGAEGESNKKALFEPFCLKPRQDRKVSPVRPLFRGKPVILATDLHSQVVLPCHTRENGQVFQTPCLVVRTKQKAPFVEALSESPRGGAQAVNPDYSVFSVKHRLSDMLRKRGVTSGVRTDVNHNCKTVANQTRLANNNSTPLSIPIYRAKCRPLADQSSSMTPILCIDGRSVRTIPTAHVKPNKLPSGHTEVARSVHAAGGAKPKPMGHSAELRKLLDQPPKATAVVSSCTVIDTDSASDGQLMPVLSPHKDSQIDGTFSTEGKDDDTDLDITPPPPALIRQQSPPIAPPRSLGKMTPPNDCVTDIIVIDDIEIPTDSYAQKHPVTTTTAAATESWIGSVFQPTANRYADNQSFLCQHVAFTYSAPSARRCSKDIKQTKFYNSVFGARHGSSLDIHNAHELDIIERSKKNALDSAFPKIKLTDDWRRDMIDYKINNLRIPEKLVRVPRKVPANFMRNIDRLIGGRSHKAATKRSYLYLDRTSRNSSAGSVKSLSSSDMDVSRPKRSKLTKNTEFSSDPKDRCTHYEEMRLVQLSRSNVLAALKTLLVPNSAGLYRDGIPVLNSEPVQAVGQDTNKSLTDGALIENDVICVGNEQARGANKGRQLEAEITPDALNRQNCNAARSSSLGGDGYPFQTSAIRNINPELITEQELSSRSDQFRTPRECLETPDRNSPEHNAVTKVNNGLTLRARWSPRSGRSARRFSPGHATSTQSTADESPQSVLSSNSVTFANSRNSSSNNNRVSPRQGSAHTPTRQDNHQKRTTTPIRRQRSESGSSPMGYSPASDRSDHQHHHHHHHHHHHTKRVKRTGKRRARSLLDELANTEGYVAEKRLSKTSDSLLVDPSQLSREERALQRAIMKFSEMEFLRRTKGSTDMTSSKSAGKSSSRKRAGELKKRAINRHKAASSGPKHTFEDFKPIVLVARTRLQASSPEASKRPTVPSQHRTVTRRRPGQHRHKRRHAFTRRPTSSKSALRQTTSTRHSASASRPATAVYSKSKRSSASSCQSTSVCLSTSASTSSSVHTSTSVRSSTSARRRSASVRSSTSGDRRKRTAGSATSDGGPLSAHKRRRKQSWSGCFLFSDRGRKGRRNKYDKSKCTLWSSRDATTYTCQISARKALFESPRVEINRISDVSNKLLLGGRSAVLSQSAIKNLNSTASFESQSASGRVDDDATSTCSSSQGDFNRHNIPPEVKRLNVCKETGETILHKAARMAYVDIVLWCCRTKYVDVNARDYAGFSALHETCVSESVETARCLLEHGADVNVASRLDGVRPLHDAIERDHFGLVRLFLSWGADPTLSTYSGRTALKIARTKQMRDFLLAYFVDLNGAFHMDTETRWELPLETRGDTNSEYPYCDVFIGLPEDDQADQGSDILFEMSDTSFIPCYCLALEKGTRPSNYVLLTDLLTRLGVNEEEFRRRYVDAVVEKRFPCDVDGPDVHRLRELYRPYSNVSLVLYDAKIREMMDVETIKMGRFSCQQQSNLSQSDRYNTNTNDVVILQSSSTAAVFRGLSNEKRPKPVRSGKAISNVNPAQLSNGSTNRSLLKSPWRNALDRRTYRVGVDGPVDRARFRFDGGIGRRKRQPEVMISLISGRPVLCPGMVSSIQNSNAVESRSPRGQSVSGNPVFVVTPEMTVSTPNKRDTVICLLPGANCDPGSKGMAVAAVSRMKAVSGLTADQCAPGENLGENDADDGCGLKITKVCSLSKTAAKQAFGSDL